MNFSNYSQRTQQRIASIIQEENLALDRELAKAERTLKELRQRQKEIQEDITIKGVVHVEMPVAAAVKTPVVTHKKIKGYKNRFTGIKTDVVAILSAAPKPLNYLEVTAALIRKNGLRLSKKEKEYLKASVSASLSGYSSPFNPHKCLEGVYDEDSKLKVYTNLK
jgi:seryl-tRNA synthetase